MLLFMLQRKKRKVHAAKCHLKSLCRCYEEVMVRCDKTMVGTIIVVVVVVVVVVLILVVAIYYVDGHDHSSNDDGQYGNNHTCLDCHINGSHYRPAGLGTTIHALALKVMAVIIGLQVLQLACTCLNVSDFVSSAFVQGERHSNTWLGSHIALGH